MPDSITVASVQQYKANVELLLQQTDSRLAGMVTTGSYVGIFIIAGSAYLVALLVIHLLVPKLEPVQLEQTGV